MEVANLHARFIECGMISYYNAKPEEMYLPKNLMQIVAKRVKIQGFIVGDDGFGPDYAQEHQENVQKWLHEGEFKVKEHVTEGIENAAEGFVGMLKGDNFGKAVLKLNHD